jgi:hypothetical protein
MPSSTNYYTSFYASSTPNGCKSMLTFTMSSTSLGSTSFYTIVSVNKAGFVLISIKYGLSLSSRSKSKPNNSKHPNLLSSLSLTVKNINLMISCILERTPPVNYSDDWITFFSNRYASNSSMLMMDFSFN